MTRMRGTLRKRRHNHLEYKKHRSVLLIYSSPSSSIREAASLFTLPSVNQRRKTHITR